MEAQPPKVALRSPAEAERLKRQVERMGVAVNADRSKRNTIHKKIEIRSLLGKVEAQARTIAPGKYRVFEIELGHAVLCYRNRGRSILSREREVVDFTAGESAGEIERVVVGICDPIERRRNRLHLCGVGNMGEWGESFLFGTPPVFWWPVGRRFVRDIIFGQLVVTSMLNTAHLTKALEALGFEVRASPSGAYDVFQKTNDKLIRIAAFGYFLAMIQYSLVSAETVTSFLGSVRDEAIKLGTTLPPDARVKMDINFAHMVGAMPKDEPSS